MLQKILLHRQLADLGMQILDSTGVHLRLRVVATTLEDVRRPFEQLEAIGTRVQEREPGPAIVGPGSNL